MRAYRFVAVCLAWLALASAGLADAQRFRPGRAPGFTSGFRFISAAAPAVQPIVIPLAGSSSPEKYVSEFTGGTQNAQVTVSSDGTSFSTLTAGRMGMDAGNAIVSATGRPVQYLAAGVSGTTLAQWEANGSTYRAKLVSQINAAVAAGKPVTFMLWQGGWNDAQQALSSSASTALHIALLRSLFSKIRSETNLPNLIILVGGSQDLSSAAQANPDLIRFMRETEAKVVNADANVRYAFNTYDLDTQSDNTAYIHQTEASQATTAQRFASQVLAVVNATAQPRAPYMTGWTPVSSTQTDVTIVYPAGATDFTPTSGITGFRRFNNAGTEVSISAAARQSATVIRLTHAAVNSNYGSVTYMPNGLNPDNTTVPHSNATLPLPFDNTGYREARIAFRSANGGTTPTGWNQLIGSGGSTGNDAGRTLALNDTAGAATGWTMTMGGYQAASSQGAVVSPAGSGIVPDAVVLDYWFNGDSVQSSNSGVAIPSTTLTMSGLTPGKAYEIRAGGSRSAATRTTVYTINGQSIPVDAGNNQTLQALFPSVVADANGQIVMTWGRQSGLQFGYLGWFIIREVAA